MSQLLDEDHSLAGKMWKQISRHLLKMSIPLDSFCSKEMTLGEAKMWEGHTNLEKIFRRDTLTRLYIGSTITNLALKKTTSKKQFKFGSLCSKFSKMLRSRKGAGAHIHELFLIWTWNIGCLLRQWLSLMALSFKNCLFATGIILKKLNTKGR